MTKRQCIDRINAAIEDTLKEHPEYYTPNDFEAQPYAKSSVAVATLRLYVKAIEAWALEVQAMAKIRGQSGKQKMSANLIVPVGGDDLDMLRKQVALDVVTARQNYVAAKSRNAQNKLVADAINAERCQATPGPSDDIAEQCHVSPRKKKKTIRKRGTPIGYPVTSPKWSSPTKKRRVSAP
jgi:hypothetical protein